MSEDSRYDPQAPEGDTGLSSQYMTKKDARWIGAVTVVLGILMVPVYRIALDARNKTVCVAHMKDTVSALALYATDNDNRYPIAYEMGPNGEPSNPTGGAPISWVTLVKRYKAKPFTCPAADNLQHSKSVDPNDPALFVESSVGFYSAYSGISQNDVDNPNQVVILAETSNHGSFGTYNPVPFKTADGKEVANDGFVIGWDNSNDAPNEETQSITRLALKGTDKGVFSDIAEPRHSAGIHAITASGAKILLRGAAAKASWGRYTLTGTWANPLVRKSAY